MKKPKPNPLSIEGNTNGGGVSCKTKYCRGNPKKYRKYCPKCRSRSYKKKHPFRYHFNYHKGNARRRKIPWELTFEQFKEIWLRSGKWEQKKSGISWEMHRLENHIGYTEDNIVIIKKALHVQITAVENGWWVDFKMKGSVSSDPVIGVAPF